MSQRNLHLLIIDPQNDFCDLPDQYRPELADGKRATPSLPVPGAHEDMLRVARLVREAGAALSHISVTLDAHQHLDIAHPTFWQTGTGEPVSPFTPVAAADVESGRSRHGYQTLGSGRWSICGSSKYKVGTSTWFGPCTAR